jgi:hypothetical protein
MVPVFVPGGTIPPPSGARPAPLGRAPRAMEIWDTNKPSLMFDCSPLQALVEDRRGKG